jgi:hypothetical protein
MSRLWDASRSGSHGGRGFHYQDAVATELVVRAWRGEFCTETGLERTLATVASAELRKSIAAAVAGVIEPKEFLARTHLLVMTSPEDAAVTLLAEQLALPPASCVAHQAVLRGKLTAMADGNGVRTADDPASLTVGEVARILDDVSEAVDPSLLEEAVREGIAELVDFATRVSDERFYSAD